MAYCSGVAARPLLPCILNCHEQLQAPHMYMLPPAPWPPPQDDHAVSSHKRARHATAQGWAAREIVPLPAAPPQGPGASPARTPGPMVTEGGCCLSCLVLL